jgi:hypothetical protein
MTNRGDRFTRGAAGPSLVTEAVAVGRARLGGGAHSDASWSVREMEGTLLRWDTVDGTDVVVEIGLDDVRRLVEAHGAAIVRWQPALAPAGTGPTGPATWPVVDEVPWAWSLHRSERGELALVVVCGSVGIYERAVLLDDEQARALERHGRRLLEVLAAEVRSTD